MMTAVLTGGAMVMGGGCADGDRSAEWGFEVTCPFIDGAPEASPSIIGYENMATPNGEVTGLGAVATCNFFGIGNRPPEFIEVVYGPDEARSESQAANIVVTATDEADRFASEDTPSYEGTRFTNEGRATALLFTNADRLDADVIAE